MSLDRYDYTVADRFLSYVRVDTQSDPDASTGKCPSTEKQKNLGNILLRELHEMGIEDAELDEHGYIYATIPSNTEKEVPVICFCAHMDTAPDAPGTDVNPIVHSNYQGDKITLPDDTSIVLDPKEDAELEKQIGNSIITASGLTLLGGDDKAGLAEIMDMAHYLMTHPEEKHGKIRLLFTPDEEIGRGANKVDVKKLGADFGYTVDGGETGIVDDQTFSADGAVLEIEGVGSHPGYAIGKMENAIRISGDILHALKMKHAMPEKTEKMEGFIHPTKVEAQLEKGNISLLIRDFDDEKLKERGEDLKKIVEEVMKEYPGSKCTISITEQYRNMKPILDKYPAIVENALEGMRRAGLEGVIGQIRGGTDGSRLSYKGLPCANLSAAEHAIHSRKEWVSIEEMRTVVKSLIHTALVREERAA